MSDFAFNPFDPATQRDPYASFARARREQPVYLHDGVPVASVFRYADVMRILRDAKTFSNVRKGTALEDEGVPDMLGSDPPEHTRLRGLVNMAFTPRIVRRLEEPMRAVANELLDDALERRRVDLVDALTYPLPVIMIAEIIGVPREERDLFRAWSDTIISVSAASELLGRELDPKAVAERDRAGAEMRAYFAEMAEARRREPREDLITGLVHAELEGSRLSFEEMLAMLQLLLLAGNETTTNLIGNTAIQLMAHRDAEAELRADPGLLPLALDEVLRFDSPVQADPRRTARDVELLGTKIPEDWTVFCWLGSANRDEEVFDRPEVFDIRRDPNRHLAFGFGQHYCLGANLARLEARVAVGALLERTQAFELASDEPLPLHPSFIFRGFRSIPVELVPA